MSGSLNQPESTMDPCYRDIVSRSPWDCILLLRVLCCEKGAFLAYF